MRFIRGDEQRWRAFGVADMIAVLLVVYRHPDNDDEELVRIISARRATPLSGGNMSKRPFTEDELAQLARLAAMRDEDIDLSDIPETTDEQWAQRRPGLYRPNKQTVTIRLDADVVAWFKDHADWRGYQTEINRVLRRHVAEQIKQRA
jgi:uncharacterized protein (DUF4415 family)